MANGSGGVIDILRLLAGVPGATVVAQLAPVSYQISLIYLGDNRITREKPPTANPPPAGSAPPPYRTRQRLLRKTGSDDTSDTIVLPTEPIFNTTSLAALDPLGLSQRAATPYDDGGDNTKPFIDIVYKIMVTDNHAVRGGPELSTIVLTPADVTSKFDYYSARGWMSDISPGIAMRIVVRKFAGVQQVDMDANFTVTVQVKDPPEEIDQNTLTARDFLETFFSKFNRTSAPIDSQKGDDNAPQVFQGQRTHPGTNQGCDVADHLRVAPFAATPNVAEANSREQAVDFKNLTNADPTGKQDGKFKLELKDESGVKTGVSDLVLIPRPIGGDNFRLVLTLQDAGGKDVRDTPQNGAPVTLLDSIGFPIAKPQGYCSGRFVVWRRVEFTLCVLVNKSGETDLDWDSITKMYRKAFVEVVKPASGAPSAGGGFFPLAASDWVSVLKAVLGNVPALNNPALLTDAVYGAGLFPVGVRTLPAVANPNNVGGTIANIARRIVKIGCAKSGLPDPGDAKNFNQMDPNGLYMVLFNDTTPSINLFGAYIGNRIFWSQKPPLSNPSARATNTTAHELGHALTIRHAVQGAASLTLVNASGSNTVLVGSTTAGQAPVPLDHDPAEFFTCLMSSVRALNAELCGMCALVLRMYARASVAQVGQFREEMLKRFGPAAITRMTRDATGNLTTLTDITGGTHNLASATSELVEVMAVGSPHAFVSRDDAIGSTQGLADLSNFPPGEAGMWTNSNPAAVTMAVIANVGLPHVRLTAVAPGTSTITYRSGKDPTASFTVNVT